MNVAVCMYGLLRTFVATANSQLKHLISLNDADLYIYAPNYNGVSCIPKNMDINEYKALHKMEIALADSSGNKIREKDLYSLYGKSLKEAVLYSYDSKRFEEATRGLVGNGIVEPSRIYSMFYHMSEAAKMIIKSEKTYDKVVICRPDLALYSDINVLNIDTEGKVHIPLGGGICPRRKDNNLGYYTAYYKNVHLGELLQADKNIFTDQLVVIDGESVNVIANLYDELDSLIKQGLPLHPETILYYTLVYRANKEVVLHNEWLYEIFRDNSLRIENDIILSNISSDDLSRRISMKWRIVNKIKSIIRCAIFR